MSYYPMLYKYGKRARDLKGFFIFILLFLLFIWGCF